MKTGSLWLREWAGVFLAAVWFCLPLAAKPIGADPLCPCQTCGQPNNSAQGEGRTSLSEGNLQLTYPVCSVRSAFGTTLDCSLIYNTYNADGSRATVDTVAGYGWTHSYNIFLFQQRSHLFRYDGEGRVTKYQLNADGSYTSGAGHFEDLVANPDGSFTLTEKDQTQDRFEAVPSTPFLVVSPVWRLVSRTDRHGNITTLSYGGGLLTQIKDTYGRLLKFQYYPNKKLKSVTDPLNRVTTFTYDATGRKLTKITDPDGKATTFTYNTLYQLSQKVDSDGRVFTYQYSGLLPVGIRDGNAQGYFSLSNPLKWAVDANALSARMDRVYQPTTTTRTDGRGNVWKYQYDTNGYVTRITAPDNTTTRYTYDASAMRVSSRTDANGHVTTYQYDSLGNQTKITDALGNQTQYTYEPVYNFVETITDASARVTRYTYDAAGNRTSETQAEGLPEQRTRTWSYDTHGNVLTETDWRGIPTTYTYDANGNRATMTEAVGQPEQRTTQYQYDAVGNLRRLTDARNDTTRYAYDSLYRLSATTNAALSVMSYQYDHRGNRVAMTDFNGHTTRYAYDTRSRLIRTTNALNQVERQTYDGNGNRTSLTDRNNHTTTYGYDVQNRLSKVTDALGNLTRYQYDPAGNVLCVIDARNNSTCYTYDAVDRRVTTTAADGGVTTYDYATASVPCCTPTLGSSLVSQQTDGNGKVTCYKYDNLDRQVRQVRKQTDTDCDVEDADDAITLTTYDAADNRLTLQEPDLNVTIYQYDSLNRLTNQVNAALDVTQYAYDAVDNRVQRTDPNGNVTTYTYDALNRLTHLSDLPGDLRTYTYDPQGNRLKDTDGNGNTTAYAYDALNRVTKVTDAMSQPTTSAYDPVGNLIEVTDREGIRTRYTYDQINRRVAIIEAVGTPVERTTSSAYDPVGNLISLTDGNSHTTQYAYDPANRRSLEIYPDPVPNTRQFFYDFAGNLIRRIDQKNQITDYHYTDLYFLDTRDYPPSDPDDHFTYDLSGRMLTAERNGWTVTFAYDGANRVTLSTQGGQPVAYTYDIPLHTRLVTYPGTRQILETTDYRQRLATVDDASSPPPIATYTYDLADRVLTRTYRNGVVATYGYNPNNWIISLSHVAAGPMLVAGFTHTYDKEGNKHDEEHVAQPTRSEAYAYDALYRLVDYRVGTLVGSTVPVPVTQTAYDLDSVGNWNKKTTDGIPEVRVHNVVNELTQIDATDLAYDNNGNLINDTVLIYEYDAENRLIKVTRLSDLRVVGEYAYDALGRRIAKIADPELISAPVETLYFYDDARIVEEQDTLGVTLATYVYGNYVDEVLTMDRGGATSYYHQNSLWSVLALTDATGTPSERYTYDAYGNPSITDGSFVPVPPNPWGTAHSPAENPWMFTGRQLDEETGLYYYRARTYGSDLGRFLQRDPAGAVQGNPRLTDGVVWAPNLYLYAEDRPTRMVDAWGLASIDIVSIPSDFNDTNSLNQVRGGINGHRGIVYDDTDDLVRQLRRIAPKTRCGTGDCIRVFEIGAHGNPTGLNHITEGNAEAVGTALSENVNFCGPCSIYLTGCNTGTDQATFPQVLANKTGCTVYGSLGFLSGWRADGTVSVSRTYIHEKLGKRGPYPGSIDAAGERSYRAFPPNRPVPPQAPGPRPSGCCALPEKDKFKDK